MDSTADEGRTKKISACLSLVVIATVILSRSSTSILTPLWLDGLNINTNTSQCHSLSSYVQIDGFAIMVISNFWNLVFFGLVLLITRIFCPYLITDNERSYDKKEFAMIGAADTVSGICFVFASSGCRTAPYLQSIAANFAIPVTFMIRFLILRKRPTCRKTACAMLVLFAEFTALLPDIVPDLQNQKARKENGGADGLPGLLWPLCFFFGFIPLAIVGVVTEKAVKFSSRSRRHLSAPSGLNIAYILFWCYFFSFLTHILLFWTDIIPGFGMSAGILVFVKGFWFNVKCFFGYEGCYGLITVVSVLCSVLLLVNKVLSSYFLRYLEGANYLAIINSVQTPLVFLFFTLFDENPVRWHPHGYVSTWLSLAALCIMLPAIYIYSTGGPEVVPAPAPTTTDGFTEPRFLDNSQQTVADDWPGYEPNTYQNERTPLIGRSSTPVSRINYNDVDPAASAVNFQRRGNNTPPPASSYEVQHQHPQKDDGPYGSLT